MNRALKTVLGALLAALACGAVLSQVRDTPPRLLVPWEVMRDVIDESSGDLAMQSEIAIAGINRNRRPEEYAAGYHETAYIVERMKEYGLDEAGIVELPKRSATTWDAEAAELWMVEPEPRKLLDLDDVPATLCSGSASADATGELVYVGPGNREEFYKDLDLRGKIALVNGSPEGARRLAVEKFGALGLVGWSSSHPEFDRDQLGWSSIRPGPGETPTFAFIVSQRLGRDLRDDLERGRRIVLRAVVKAGQVPYREELAVGLIRGTEFPEEELVFTAHVFEGFAKQGANDNASGCAVILETARVLRQLVADGKVPPLKRSVRFLFIPEISGTTAYIDGYPEIARRFFANINHDMAGEGLVKNLSAVRLETTPFSLPTYLNDVTASFVEWMGKTQRAAQESGWLSGAVLSPNGSRDPFYYSIDPYQGGSDHVVFLDGAVRVPAVLLIVWPDMWYHTSGDTTDKSDSTQLKRMVAISAAEAILLANAGPAEAERIMAEVAARQGGRLGDEKARAEAMLPEAAAGGLAAAFKEARNVVVQAHLRERETLSSARFFFKGNAGLDESLQSRLRRLSAVEAADLAQLEDAYRRRCDAAGVKPVQPAPTADEIRLDKVIPVRTAKPGGSRGARAEMQKLGYSTPRSISRAEFELRNFIDGKRSVLEIRNAASAEFEPLPLADVEAWFEVQEKLGLVMLLKKDRVAIRRDPA